MARVVNSRIRLLLLCILLVFAALLARASWIATVARLSLSQMAQTQTKATVVLPAGRGTIFDSMGTPLALGEQATTVFADPRQVLHPRTEAKAAARVLGLKAGQALPAAREQDARLRLRRAEGRSRTTAAKLAKLKLPGFGFYGEERRTYPQRSVAAQVLGYAGVDNKGLSGLELELDGVAERQARRADRRPRPVRAPDQASSP